MNFYCFMKSAYVSCFTSFNGGPFNILKSLIIPTCLNILTLFLMSKSSSFI